MDTPRPIVEAVALLDDAIDRALSTSGRDQHAINSALWTIYGLREYCKREVFQGREKEYYDRAREEPEGKTTEAIVLARGLLQHDLMSAPKPEHRPLSPREDLYPSPALFPGMNLTWLPLAHMEPAARKQILSQQRKPPKEPRGPIYEDRLAGCEVLPSLVIARNYLASLVGQPPRREQDT